MRYIVDDEKKAIYVLDDGTIDSSLEDSLGEKFHKYKVLYQDKNEFYSGSGNGRLITVLTAVTDNPDSLEIIYSKLYSLNTLEDTVVQWMRPTITNHLSQSWGVFRTTIEEDDCYEYINAEKDELKNLSENLIQEYTDYASELGQNGLITLERYAMNDVGIKIKYPESAIFAILPSGSIIEFDKSIATVNKWLQDVVLKSHPLGKDIAEAAIMLQDPSKGKPWPDPDMDIPLQIARVYTNQSLEDQRTKRRETFLIAYNEFTKVCSNEHFETMQEMNCSQTVKDILSKYGIGINNFLSQVGEEFEQAPSVHFRSIGILHEKDPAILEQKKNDLKSFQEEFYELCLKRIREAYTGDNWSSSPESCIEYFLEKEMRFRAIADKMQGITKIDKPLHPFKIKRDQFEFEPTVKGLDKYVKETYGKSLNPYLKEIGAVNTNKAEVKAFVEEKQRYVFELLEKYLTNPRWLGNSLPSYNTLLTIDLTKRVTENDPDYWRGGSYYKGCYIGFLFEQDFGKYIKKKYKKVLKDWLASVNAIDPQKIGR